MESPPPRTPQLDPDQRRRLTEETEALMRLRLRRLLPAMVALNAVHVVVALPGSPLRIGDHAEDLHRWADAVVLLHGVTGLLAVGLIVVLYRTRRSALWVGFCGAVLYQLHAAAIAGADQLNSGTIVPYVGYAIVNAIVIVMSVRMAVALYVVGALAVMVAVIVVQAAIPVQIGILAIASSVAVPAISIVWYLNRSREEAFRNRDVIARQSRELTVLNDELADRVERQVADLRARSQQVEVLNVQLRQQVNDRSRELARALEELARHGPSSPHLSAGQVLAERFSIQRSIGVGGMGHVYAGTDLLDGRHVAVKVLHGRHTPEAMARFLREVQSATLLDAPNIVRMLHVDVTEDGRLFQVQELVEGHTLAQWLRELTHFHAGPALRILDELRRALMVAHREGVVHRDVKPSNVMLIAEGPGLKLLDFGIAKLDLAEQGTTQTGRLIGTPAYVAPELWAGERPADARADLFSLGVTWHQILTGDLPTLPLRPSFSAMLSAEAEALLRGLLDPDPAVRPGLDVIGEVLAASLRGLEPLADMVTHAELGPPRPADVLFPPTHLSFA